MPNLISKIESGMNSSLKRISDSECDIGSLVGGIVGASTGILACYTLNLDSHNFVCGGLGGYAVGSFIGGTVACFGNVILDREETNPY